MTQKIFVLVNDSNQLPVIAKDLSASGIPPSDFELIHKRPERLRDFIGTRKDSPRITDREIHPILRNLNVSEDDIQYCESRIDHGATLLVVDVPENKVDDVTGVLRKHRIAVPSELEATSGVVLRKGTKVGGGYPTDLARLEKISSTKIKAASFNPTGWKVVDPDGNNIGDIKYLIGSPTTGQSYFAVVDCGGIFKDKLVLLPFDRFQFDINDEEAIVPFDKDQVKNAPNFSEREADYGSYSGYWDQFTESRTYAHTER